MQQTDKAVIHFLENFSNSHPKLSNDVLQHDAADRAGSTAGSEVEELFDGRSIS